jgi:hypothetical protein
MPEILLIDNHCRPISYLRLVVADREIQLRRGHFLRTRVLRLVAQ